MGVEVVVASVEKLAETLAADLEREARRANGAGRNITIALPGGSIAEAFFPRLARTKLDWTRVEFFWVDERAVPPSSPDSNYALARSAWLEPARVPETQVHRMPADHADYLRATAGYADDLIRVAGQPPLLDYVLLGVGPDGHVASLFPGHALLGEEKLAVAFLTDAPKPPPRRMTLTLPTLGNASRVVIAAFGKTKAAVVAEALDHGSSQLPVALVARRAQRLFFLLDPEAGEAAKA